jgi:hypothetical protein
VLEDDGCRVARLVRHLIGKLKELLDKKDSVSSPKPARNPNPQD